MDYLESFVNAFFIVLEVIKNVLTEIWVFSCNAIGEPLTIGLLFLISAIVIVILFTFSINRTQGGIENFSASTMKFFLLVIGVFVIFFFLYLINFFEI